MVDNRESRTWLEAFDLVEVYEKDDCRLQGRHFGWVQFLEIEVADSQHVRLTLEGHCCL